MGYDVHITRAKFWADNEGAWIAAEEWLQYVAEDSELTLDAQNGEYFALWADSWLDWSDGNVSTKNPDDPLLDKMVDIAKKLNANVQGDDGEVYLGGGSDNYLPPECDESPPTETKPPRSGWLAWLFGDGN